MRLGALLRERFEIEQRVGTGGMGEVFRARDLVSGAPVAVKIVSATQGHHAARFAREVEVLAELSHPGIVRHIFHSETPAGELFLVMEWLDGEVLKARLERGPLAASEAVTLATRVASVTASLMVSDARSRRISRSSPSSHSMTRKSSPEGVSP